MTPPRATYRVQLRQGVDFETVRRALPYLDRLGISHVYLSPLFTARSGSAHGYDVTRPDEIDPVLGGREGFERLAGEAANRTIGIVLDIVPNHMAATPENPWWYDVLRRGRGSRYAPFFDIDWDREGGGGRVILPLLATPYAEALDEGRIRLVRGASGQPQVACEGQLLPLRPETCGEIEAADPDAFHRQPALLHEILERQHYPPVYWRAAADRLNYRRFFDVNELVALNMEREDVFAAVHCLVLELVAAGRVAGLRIDHVDGLADPRGYLVRLRSALAAAGAPPSFPVWVEKILGRGERLRPDWPVQGTTGYEALNDFSGALCSAGGVRALERFYARRVARPVPFRRIAAAARREVLSLLFPAENRALAAAAAAIAAADPLRAELGPVRVGSALRELLAALDVYRTYIADDGPAAEDRAVLDRALALARRESRGELDDALAFVGELCVRPETPARRAFLRRLQQLSGPVAAKAVEDTAFYRDARFVLANEVGGDPEDFGCSVAELHRRNAERRQSAPLGLLATNTHDTKRGEGVRARLALLTECPREWAAAVSRWRHLNRPHRRRDTPEPVTEYFL